MPATTFALEESPRQNPPQPLTKEEADCARERQAYLSRADDELGPIGCLARFVLILFSFAIGWGISQNLIVILFYGWSRTSREEIHVVQIPKHGPWQLSNGDLLPEWLTAVHLVATVLGAFIVAVCVSIVLEALGLMRAIKSAKPKNRKKR